MGHAGSIPIIILAGAVGLPGLMQGPASAAALPYEWSNSAPPFSTAYGRNDLLPPTKRELRVEVEITCKECREFTAKNESVYTNEAKFDPPLFPLTCTRLALAAAAKYRYWCRQIIDNKSGKWTDGWACDSGGGIPSVIHCCGDWISYDDPLYADYPTARERVQIDVKDQRYWYTLDYRDVKDISNTTRMIVQHDPGKYNINHIQCRNLKPNSDLEFMYWMSNLREHGVLDADKNGKVWGKEMWAPEGGIIPMVDPWSKGAPKYFDITPEQALEHDLALLAEGWRGGP
ncbi:uncharacterized protein A1O9_05935 [Exophiala aquamarina CBS 119918]|uniref:Uncharacterized protein n=1 Tax=Exophiala aquamarina CBS 119918 TaxID=1182545 RepID=A0A072PE05_9EURO|nr:uncharacterized protein A1O9_05935 [Exophiala aquamarina CBS 119918]KEF58012.1 hypothetical protein A1O9_05935 [Exophiala aquamarina CBS 119918]